MHMLLSFNTDMYHKHKEILSYTDFEEETADTSDIRLAVKSISNNMIKVHGEPLNSLI